MATMDTACGFLSTLTSFRSSLHNCFGKRSDALFELTDAMLTAGPQPSPVHLSLGPAHRRGWGSLYAALSHGTVDTSALQSLLSRHPLSDEDTRVYAVDCSVWARCDAESSPERGYYFHPFRHCAGQPIVAGWSYQWVAQLGFARDSWTAPVDVRRVHPCENPNAVAVEQIKGILARGLPNGLAPLFVFDAGYDPVQLSQGLEGTQGLHPGAAALRPLLLRRPRASNAVREGWQAAQARDQVRLQGFGYLVARKCRAPG